MHFGCLNAQSVKNKTLSIEDFIKAENFDLLAITETWLGGALDQKCINELLPDGYSIKSVPRLTNTKGGGVALVYRNSIKISVIQSRMKYTQFEYLECTADVQSTILRIFVIYRPPPTKRNGLSVRSFFFEFQNLLDASATINEDLMIVGDLNFHVDDSTNKDAILFSRILDSYNLLQHVKEPTHIKGHTLDLFITRNSCSIVGKVTVIDPGLSDRYGSSAGDHFAISAKLNISKPDVVHKVVSFRGLHSVSIDDFRSDIEVSDLCSPTSESTSNDELIDRYNKTLYDLVDKHAPLCTKLVPVRSKSSWYSQDLLDAKRLKRRLERKWGSSKLHVDHQIYRKQSALVNYLAKQQRIKYYSSKLNECGRNQAAIYKIANHLLGKCKLKPLPECISNVSLAAEFNKFFYQKIFKLHSELKISADSFHSDEVSYKGRHLSSFDLVSEEYVLRLIKLSPNKYCESDPLPSWLLKACTKQLLPVISEIVNRSLSSGTFPSCFKQAIIHPLLKKQSLNKEELKHYRPVANLPFEGEDSGQYT